MLVSARETEEALATRLAQVRDDVVVHEREANPAAGERGARASQGDQPPILVEEPGVPVVLTRPRHGPARVLAPVTLEPELVAREDHRDAGHRHLKTDSDELTSA